MEAEYEVDHVANYEAEWEAECTTEWEVRLLNVRLNMKLTCGQL